MAENAPIIWRVFGRSIAGPAFGGYSDDSKNTIGTWNEESLDAYLRDIEGFSEDSERTFVS